MTNKKYKLTTNTKKIGDLTLFQIEALIDSKFCKKGELGGWIEKEENLDVYGNAWVYGNAQVYGDARVYGDAQVSGDAQVYGDAWVYGNARVYGKIKLKTILCSKFNFEFDWQIDLWHKKEKEFEKECKNKL